MKNNKTFFLIVFVATLLILPTITIASAESWTFDETQSRQTWTFTASQVNNGGEFFFKNVTGGYAKLSVTTHNAVFNSTNFFYLNIYNNDGSYGSPTQNWAFQATGIKYWTLEGAETVTGAIIANQNYNNGVDYQFYMHGQERYFTYFDATNESVTTAKFIVSPEIANYSRATIQGLGNALTSGYVTITLTPEMNVEGSMDAVIEVLVIMIVLSLLGGIVYKLKVR